MSSHDKSNPAAALIALFTAAIAAGYSSTDLWQMSLGLAFLIGMVVLFGNW